jgi:hypothetical protein
MAWDWLTGSESKVKDYHPYTDEQEAFINQIVQQTGPLNMQGMDYLRSILSNDPRAFEQFEAPIKQQYEEETIPGILERFSSSGARNSSALNQSLARSGRDLSTQLSAQRANLRDSALGRLMQMNQTGLTQTKQPYTVQGREGLAGPLLNLGASVLGGPLAGGMKSLTNWLSSKFGGAASGEGGEPYDFLNQMQSGAGYNY